MTVKTHARPLTSTGAILFASGIEKHFGGVHALEGVNVKVHAGEVHALMGENGAGKSTLGKILAGVHRADAGIIRLDGQEIIPANPLEAQRLGIGIIFQELDLFPNLSVAENIAVRNLHFSEGIRVSRKRLTDFCRPYLEQVGLTVPADRLVNSLSMGQMQLVAIARALSTQARILVMDEPTSALTDDAVEMLFTLIRKLKSAGVAIIYVSHKMDEIFRIADRVTVLRDGNHVGTRETAATDMGELIRMMVGRKLSTRQKSRSHATDVVVLEADMIRTQTLSDVSFQLHRGEVLGVAGLVGSGRSAIGRALFGLDKVTSGRWKMHRTPYTARSPRDAMRRGVGLVPEDRKAAGLMMQMGVRENVSLSSLDACSRGFWIRTDVEDRRYKAIVDRIQLKAASPLHPASSLSGGNQQKTLLGRWLMVDPELLFLDDPTRGVDVGVKENIYEIIEELAIAGKAVLMVSSELSELLRCCDRILVMNDGHLVGSVEGASASEEAIMTMAAGPRLNAAAELKDDMEHAWT